MRNAEPCPFCNAEGAVLTNSLAHARLDRFPVTRGHLLLTAWHAHLHLIPRYRKDAPNPRGGVRAVIPGKQIY